VPIGAGVFIGGSDAEESRFYWMDGPEASLEFFYGRNLSGSQLFSSLRGATAVPTITAGSSTQSEIRSWDISSSTDMVLLRNRQITFYLKDKNDPTKIDFVRYNNSSGSDVSISTVLARLKLYFDNNSAQSFAGTGYNIVGQMQSTAAGIQGLFSQFNFTYSLADNRTGSFAFTSKNAGAVTDGSPASFQIRGVNLFAKWDSGQPNNSPVDQDYVKLVNVSGQGYVFQDHPNTASAYLVEYNAAANSTLLRREFSLPSPGVTTVNSGSDPNVLSALNYANFTGSISGYTTSLNGSQLTFTSTQPLTNITPNIAHSFTAASGSPTVFSAPVITDGGNSNVLVAASLQFPPGGLNAGDSVTVAGLRFTAGRTITAGEAAGAFASLANGATTGAGTSYGVYSGSLVGFSSGAIVNSNQLVFTQIPSGTQTSINTSSNIAKAIVGTGLTVGRYSTAQNAIFTVGDTSYTKTSNTISDAITGVTFSLMEEGEANILVELGEDKSEETIKGLMTAYNDLIKSANAMTANSSNSLKPGAFANSPTSLSFISDIKRKVVDGARYDIGKTDSSGQPYRLSLASLGLEYQLDGTLVFNRASLLTAQSSGLREKLLSGLNVGYQSSTDNLSKILEGHLSSISSLAYQTSESTQSVASLNKEKNLIEDRLEKIQAGYIAQYSNLNKLLFQLNSTSTSLRSALDGLTNMDSNK
jgi:flagellar hook-associated protein 2